MKKIIIPIGTLFFSGLAHAQLSTTENYIYSKTYLSDPTEANVRTSETVQYFDGLGRPKQVINIKASPSNQDLVTTIPYDGFGRQIDSWLPVPMSTLNGGIQSGVSGSAQSYYGDSTPFVHKNLEASPLDRVLSQVQPGLDWQVHPVQFGYEANINGEVKKYVTTLNPSTLTSSIPVFSTYGAGQLYKNTVTDEDGNKTIEFKNGEGQIILLRKMLNATESADTYYVYNDYNQLAFVIPPLASVATSLDQTILDNLCYQYKYDGRNRLVEKRLPGKDWEYLVYDKADRLVLTQDANLRPDHKWLFNKYDKFGRIIYTGIAIDNGDREAVQGWILFTYGINTEVSGSYTKSGIQIPYGNTAYPQNIESILTVNFYDTYPTGTPAFTPTIPGQSAVLSDIMSSEVNTKSLALASYVKNIEDDNWTKNYIYYDTRGRAMASHSINHLGGYTKKESKLDFTGITQRNITRHRRLSSDTERIIDENFTYDLQNRLVKHTHKVDNNPQEEILAQNNYNDLSQIISKKVGGTNVGTGLQEINYEYNIRGWLTKINDPVNLGTDLFGYKIKYTTVEGATTPYQDFPNLNVEPRFNGNIAEVDWKTATDNNSNIRRYGYVYDRLNRLLAGFYQKDTNPTLGEYFERVTYDLNGNIKTLQRTANSTGTTATNIDLLTYNYKFGNQSNMLESVKDDSQNNGGYPFFTVPNAISYDPNGNMKDQMDKNISAIEYNYLNLPTFINAVVGGGFFPGMGEGQNHIYKYRADGTKYAKRVNDISPYMQQFTEIDYLDGFQYQRNYTKMNTSQNPTDTGIVLKFYPTTEGYFDFEKNKYIYNYTDHLGNIRLSYMYNGTSIEVLEENNYYPFGLKHSGYNILAGNFGYNYKYNGKELQETGMYDYGARFYMPDLGRWGVVDPLAEKYNRFTPYNYTLNNPIKFIDPSGMDPLYNWDTGKYMDGNKEVSYEQAMNFYGLNGNGSDCPKCKETKQQARNMVSSGRSKGLNFAADNLEYFLNGKDTWSKDRKISPKFLKNNSSVRHGTALNITKIFNKKFNQQIENMKLGETITLNGTWTDSYYASITEPDLLYGSGGYIISTNVSLKVTRGNIPGVNGYTVSGDIEVGYFDTYNWDPGKGDYVPGFGSTNDKDFDDLVKNREAANFNMTSSWNINISDWGYLSGSVRAGVINTVMQSR